MGTHLLFHQLTQRLADELFHGQRTVELGDGGLRLAAPVAQGHKRASRLLRAGPGGGRRGVFLPARRFRSAEAELVLQLHYNALGELGAYALRAGDGARVALRDGKGELFGREGRREW